MPDELRPLEEHDIYRKIISRFLSNGVIPTLKGVDCAYGILSKYYNPSDEKIRLTVDLMVGGKVCP